MNQDSYEDICENISIAENEIKNKIKSCQNFNKVILLGNTGSGKTTVSCIIADKKIKIKKYGRKSLMLDFEGIEAGGKSITRIPSLMTNNKDDILIGDCPGFLDTNGTSQEIVNAFTIDFLLSMFSSNFNKVKILLIIGIEEISANRAQSITQNFERMEKMFPNKEQLEQGVGIVFTRTDINDDGMDCIEKININPAPIVQKWCNFFEGHQDRIFTLPFPLQQNIGQYYKYENRRQLISFIKKDQITNPVHFISLSKSATDDIANEHYKICQKLNDIINNLFETIFEEFNNVSNTKELNYWIQTLNRFKNIEIKDSKDLIRVISEYLPSKKVFTNYIKYLSKFEAFHSFINKVLNINNDYIQKIFIKKNSNAIAQLISTQKHLQSLEIRDKELKTQKKIVAKQEQIAENMKTQLLEQKKINEEIKNEMQQRLDDQEFEMERLREKMNILTNYSKLEIYRPKIMKESLIWKQVGSTNNTIEKEYKGILQTLFEEIKTNIHDDGLINITSNSINGPSFEPRNLGDFETNKRYGSSDQRNSYICFDFIDQKIQIQSYIIQSIIQNSDDAADVYLRNWVIEVSNDNTIWEIIDEQNNCEGLHGNGIKCIFNPGFAKDDFYRYVRLRQTGHSWNDNYIFGIEYIDFYGIFMIPN